MDGARCLSFNGKYTQLRYVNLWPRPLQQPHPPVWIPGSGSIETWDFCAEYDYQYSFLSFFGYLAARKVADGYWNVIANKGKPLNPYSMAFARQWWWRKPTSRPSATSLRTWSALQPVPAHLCGFRRRAGLPHAGFAQGGNQSGDSRRSPQKSPTRICSTAAR